MRFVIPPLLYAPSSADSLWVVPEGRLITEPRLLIPRKRPIHTLRHKMGHTLSRGLLRHLQLNRGGTLTTADSGPLKIAGNLINAPDWIIHSDQGLVLDLAGTNEYVELGIVGVTEPATVIMRIRLEGDDDNRILCQSDGGTTTAGAIRWDGNDPSSHDDGFGVWPGSGYWEEIVPKGDVSLNTWYDLAVVYTSGGSCIGFLNGVQKSTASSTFDFATNYMGLGDDYSSSGYGNNFNGQLADFRLYDRALSPAEILALYRDPFQDMEPEPRIFFLGAAAAGGDVSGVGDSAGTSTVTGDGASEYRADGASTGVATAPGVGASIHEADGASAGTSTAPAVGDFTSDAEGDGASAGAGTAPGVGESIHESTGSSTGTSTAVGIADIGTSTGTAAGTSTAPAVGVSDFAGVGNAAGVGTAPGISAVTAAEGAGTAAGTSTATGIFAPTLADLAAQNSFLMQLELGKRITDPVAGTYSVLDKNGAVLVTGPLYEDVSEAQLYRGDGAEVRGPLAAP